MLERANELRYANRIGPPEREAARGAMRMHIRPILDVEQQRLNLNGVQDPVDERRRRQQQIPLPNLRNGRRPYHELARENAEALNALLTREIPILTNHLQQTMELMNQVLRRHLDN